MLRKGQIKFSKKASIIAKKIFKNKKISEFLIVIKPGESKSPDSEDLYKRLLGTKQDPDAERKVYTNDITRARKFFEVYLLKEGKLSLIFSPTYACVLYITKDQQSKYEKLKIPKHIWPAVSLNEKDKTAVNTFEQKIKTKSIDLSELILNSNVKN